MQTDNTQKRFMDITKRLKAAYDICCGSEDISKDERDHIHFYMAIRSIIYKLTRGNAPDSAQMNAKVREMIAEAIKSDGVEEIFKMGGDDEEGDGAIDIFDEDYLAKIDKIKLPNTKIQLLQKRKPFFNKWGCLRDYQMSMWAKPVSKKFSSNSKITTW